MNHKILFHPDVTIDIKGAYSWYEKELHGLGDSFLSELELGYSVIVNFPNTWASFEYGFKRYILNRFPFSIVYKIQDNNIYIVSIMHNSRKPNYWIKRLKEE